MTKQQFLDRLDKIHTAREAAIECAIIKHDQSEAAATYANECRKADSDSQSAIQELRAEWERDNPCQYSPDVSVDLTPTFPT